MNKVLLASALIFVSSSAAFAMEPMTDSMMHTGTMMTHEDTMMKKDTMMTSDAMMKKDTMMTEKKMSVAQIAKKHGYNWVRDRKMLAQKAGITGYRGTAAQNLKIKTYLMSMSADSMMK